MNDCGVRAANVERMRDIIRHRQRNTSIKRYGCDKSPILDVVVDLESLYPIGQRPNLPLSSRRTLGSIVDVVVDLECFISR